MRPVQSWVQLFKVKVITFEKIKIKFNNTLGAGLKFYLFIYSQFYPPITRKRRGATRARLGVADHLVYHTYMG